MRNLFSYCIFVHPRFFNLLHQLSNAAALCRFHRVKDAHLFCLSGRATLSNDRHVNLVHVSPAQIVVRALARHIICVSVGDLVHGSISPRFLLAHRAMIRLTSALQQHRRSVLLPSRRLAIAPRSRNVSFAEWRRIGFWLISTCLSLLIE